MNTNSKIYVTGLKGLVGFAIKRKLEYEGHNNIIHKTSNELDLRNQEAVKEFFVLEKPNYVFS